MKNVLGGTLRMWKRRFEGRTPSLHIHSSSQMKMNEKPTSDVSQTFRDVKPEKYERFLLTTVVSCEISHYGQNTSTTQPHKSPSDC